MARRIKRTILKALRSNLSKNYLGHVRPADLLKEGDQALTMFQEATSLARGKKYAEALNAFFKSAAVASNVLFTVQTHETVTGASSAEKKLLEKMKGVMDTLIADATKGIRMISKGIAAVALNRHVREMHKGAKKSAAKKSATRKATTLGRRCR